MGLLISHYAHRWTQKMLLRGSSQGNNETCFSTETLQDEHWTAVPLARTILFKSNIDAKSAPPYFALVIKWHTVSVMETLLPFIPLVKILFHNPKPLRSASAMRICFFITF